MCSLPNDSEQLDVEPSDSSLNFDFLPAGSPSTFAPSSEDGQRGLASRGSTGPRPAQTGMIHSANSLTHCDYPDVPEDRPHSVSGAKAPRPREGATLLLVPKSFYLARRDAAAGTDLTTFMLHYLVPASWTNDEVAWSRPHVERALSKIMLSHKKVTNVLFNARGARQRDPYRIVNVRDPRALAHAGGDHTGVLPGVTEYNEWSSLQVKAWDDKLKCLRLGRRGPKVYCRSIDLHCISKSDAGAAIRTHTELGGLVCTDNLEVSQGWTQEAGEQWYARFWKNLQKAKAELSVLPDVSLPRTENPSISFRNSQNFGTMAQATTLVVLTNIWRETYTAEVKYHMILSLGSRSSLDAHITQRRAVVSKLRLALTNLDLYNDPRGPTRCLAGWLATSEVGIAVQTYRVLNFEESTSFVRDAEEGGALVITGDVRGSLFDDWEGGSFPETDVWDHALEDSITSRQQGDGDQG